jgi:transcriptional regulator with XRE-family HTH domain
MNQSAGQSPHLLLGKMLAYYRTRAGLTPEQLGALVYLSGSQIRKVENGNRTLTPDLAKACENIRELGCNGALTELLDLLSEQLKRRPFPGWFEDWPEKEAQAKRLRTFQPLVVPGLLQTEAYARAILSTRLDSTPDEIELSVTGRMERQTILERDQPPEFSVILDEVALRRPVGGPDVMRGQLAHLTMRRPTVAVQVIPLAAGAHEGLRGAGFVIADFEEGASAAYQDAASSGQIIEDAGVVGALAHTWDTLRLDALPRVASLSLIEKIREEL